VYDNTKLESLYSDDLNFDGVDALYIKAKAADNKITKEQVKQFLKSKSTNQIHHVDLTKKEFIPIYADDYYSYQIDLTFLPQYKAENNNIVILFTAININTRFAYASTAKDKTTESIDKCLDQFLSEAKKITSITSDSGSEFIYTNWFKDHDIETYYVVDDSHKLGIINRFHRTL
jgi:IS30 family transposase